MKKRIVLACMLAIALFAFVAPTQAHAKEKLTEKQVEDIYKEINKHPEKYNNKVREALKNIVKLMDVVKNDKSVSSAARKTIEDLLGCNKYYSMFSNTITLIGMAYNYKKADIKSGTELTFDAIEFFGGMVLPGNYVSVAVNGTKNALAKINNNRGQLAFDDYGSQSEYYSSRMVGVCFDSEWMNFAKTWFAAEYSYLPREKNWTDNYRDTRQRERDIGSLARIAQYIEALKTLRSAGLIK